MDYDEQSDILGGRLQHVSPQSSVFSDPGQITLLLGLGLAALYAWVQVLPSYRQWRENRYRKAMRRRHGIPDDDNRPFNVAYAAALQARKGDQRRGKALVHEEADSTAIQHDGMEGSTGAISQPAFSSSGLSGARAGYQSLLHRDVDDNRVTNTASHSHPLHSGTAHVAESVLPNGQVGNKSRPSSVKQPMVTRSSHGKHALDDDVDSEPETQAKKTRLEGEELNDGDGEAEWHESNDEMDIDHVHSVKRGSKRVASSEDEDFAERLDKRARKVSIDRTPQLLDHDMEDEADEDDEDVEVSRGKKRDRTEAGSSFGGDDSVLDDDEKPQRRRRRRISTKATQSSFRGQKRTRDLHSLDSDDSDSEAPQRPSLRKKRGRRSQDEVVSNDPLCKGRRIGEEWESNGVRFKVGPNGQRLRQELVKKSRTRFPMPSDSQHPDRRAHVDVYVETWLTEEEYQAAKERHELAWQDEPTSPPESHAPGDVPDSPSKAGKNLLWSSTMSSRESPAKRGPLRQSITTNVVSRLNVFPTPAVPAGRRIATAYQAPASPAADSPKLQKTKSYSKWEKQDLEAAAMSKIRDRQQSASQKATPSVTPSATSTAAPSLFGGTPTTASSKAPEKPAAPTGSSSTFSFAPSSTPAGTTTAQSSTGPKPSVSGTPGGLAPASTKPATSTFSFAPLSSTTPSTTPSAAAATSSSQSSAPQTSLSVPNFFQKPATQAASTPTATSSSIPNLFPKPAETASSSAPSSSANKSAESGDPAKTNPTFSFAPPQTQSPFINTTNAAPKTDQAKPSPGVSLLARIGMGPPPNNPTSTSSTPTFSFSKPESSTSNTAAPPANTTDATKSASTAPASTAPKFSFGITPKPASTTPAPAANATSTAPSSSIPASVPTLNFGANNSSQPATSSPANPFGAPANKDKEGNASSTSRSMFGGFGTTNAPASTAFGNTSTTPTSGGGAKSAEPPKSTFSFGAPSATSSSPFGAAPASSAFGATPTPAAASSLFGTTPSASSPFGAAATNNAAKSTEGSKSMFGFGGPAANTNSATTTSSSFASSPFGTTAPSAQSNDSAKPAGEAAKPTFSFGTSSSAPAFGATSTPSAFGGASKTPAPTSAFGATSTPSAFGSSSTSSAFGASSTPSAFGAPSTPSAFGASSTPTFGASTTAGAPASGNKSTFSFGNPAATTSTPSGAPASNAENKATPPTFSFGATSSNNTSTPSATSAFGAPSSTTTNGVASSPFGAPQTQSGSSTFSFGAPSGAFSFGSNSGQSAQK